MKERDYGSAYKDRNHTPGVVAAGPRLVLHDWRLHSHFAGPRADRDIDPRASGQAPGSMGIFIPRCSFPLRDTSNPVPVFKSSSALLAYFPVLNAKTSCPIVLSRRNEQWFTRAYLISKDMRCVADWSFGFSIPPDLTTHRLSPSVTADGERRPSFEQNNQGPQRNEISQNGGLLHSQSRTTANELRSDLCQGFQMPLVFGVGSFSFASAKNHFASAHRRGGWKTIMRLACARSPLNGKRSYVICRAAA